MLGALGNESPKGEAEASFRTGWLRHFRVALSSAGGAAILLALVALLQRQPAEGFRLLGEWGPWPVVGLVALIIVGKSFSRIVDSVQTTFSAIVTSVQQGTRASERQAEALTKLAEQGGEQARETHRLAMFAAQEGQNLYERLDRQDEALTQLARLLDAVRSRLCEGSEEANGHGSGS